MFTDYAYYRTVFHGTKIDNKDEYLYLSRQANKYIKPYAKEVSEDVKDCECAISEYLQSALKQGNLTSESIPNFYSASWSSSDSSARIKEINSILELYLGDKYSSVGIVKIIN